jgi:hypothetical protein
MSTKVSKKFKLYYSGRAAKHKAYHHAILINKPYSKTVYFMTFQLGV